LAFAGRPSTGTQHTPAKRQPSPITHTAQGMGAALAALLNSGPKVQCFSPKVQCFSTSLQKCSVLNSGPKVQCLQPCTMHVHKQSPSIPQCRCLTRTLSWTGSWLCACASVLPLSARERLWPLHRHVQPLRCEGMLHIRAIEAPSRHCCASFCALGACVPATVCARDAEQACMQMFTHHT